MPGIRTLNVAISPCPNDTFIFGAWVLGLIPDLEGCRSRFAWKDVDILNRWAREKSCDMVKVSAGQALDLQDEYYILASGAAFGLTHGPKLVARKGLETSPKVIAVPGLQTTACCLLEAALDHDFQALPVPFDRIVSCLEQGHADAGLLIHETALIYQQYQLKLLLDLGSWWREQAGDLPLPLGCIIMPRRLGLDLKARAEEQIRSSLDTALEKQSQLMPLISHLAQEMDPNVIDRHIRAYVNQYSRDMGEEGTKSLQKLQQLKTSMSDISDRSEPSDPQTGRTGQTNSTQNP
ncbi:1,4-dihydroxy-6-naphthoate synthase [Desulfonatronospira sp.]|uniref:1,4-dihydroxy-6-naphthoate synthase n=1 Tax=Desulfonatronospira sp. TaxID=1962951 RepID=UPI0025BC94B2|nr:1,4-dihydroxy-6-naphthoate synthase [Desulfonatronospira sp.]